MSGYSTLEPSTMRTILIVLGLVAAALAAPNYQYEPIFTDYHQEIGIYEAARIKAGEEAVDFDGSRIVGGTQSSLGQHPHMGGLVITLTTGQQSVCGSSLVSGNRLVTAAHCWRHGNSQASQFTVVLGSIHLFSGGLRINTNQVEMHANYNMNNLNNDVAIIRTGNIAFNNNIRSIAMASGTNLFVGVTAVAAGFGRTGDNVGIGSNQVLSHVNLPVISNAECQTTFGGTIVASTLCTSGANGRSTCGGDSGGPLVASNSLIGITSFGSAQGCQRGFPAGFARVTSFVAWFRARM